MAVGSAGGAMTVAELLQKSREAHLRYRQSSGHIDSVGGVRTVPDPEAGRTAIVDALEFRNEAEAADPDHEDAAWAADTAANRGVTSATMLSFYRNFFLTP